jgi:hypothetical protein
VTSANAAPPCPSGVVCPPDGTMHKPPPGPNAGNQTSGENQPKHMRWRHRHNPDVGLRIYINDGYGDGYGWRHHKHCKMVKTWRHHHRVWVKRCVWHHKH